MALSTANIYHGPIVKLEINSVEYYEIGQNNAEITFESQLYDLHDGQQVSGYGLGKVVIELVGTTAALITSLKAAMRLTTPDIYIYTAYAAADDYTRFAIMNIMLSYEVKRGFGDDPHSIVITGTKKALDESNFVSRSVVTP